MDHGETSTAFGKIARSTGLGGSSLGGLVTLYLGLRHPELFGRLALMSPSVWWNHKSILSYLNEHAPQVWERPKVWLDVGDREGSRTLRDVEHLARRMKANGWRPGETMLLRKGTRRNTRRGKLGQRASGRC